MKNLETALGLPDDQPLTLWENFLRSAKDIGSLDGKVFVNKVNIKALCRRIEKLEREQTHNSVVMPMDEQLIKGGKSQAATAPATAGHGTDHKKPKTW